MLYLEIYATLKIAISGETIYTIFVFYVKHVKYRCNLKAHPNNERIKILKHILLIKCL